MDIEHHAIITGFLFGAGACVGSFVNVCVHRLPRGMSVVHPRSRCPSCFVPIAARDNLPIVGWLRLGGRCRSCGLKISPRYILIETLVGLLLAASYLALALAPGRDPLEAGFPALAGWLLGCLIASALVVSSLALTLDAKTYTDRGIRKRRGLLRSAFQPCDSRE